MYISATASSGYAHGKALSGYVHAKAMNGYIHVKELHLIKVRVSFLYFTLSWGWGNPLATGLGKLCSCLLTCKTPDLECYSVILSEKERGREWGTNKQEREQSQKPEESNLFWHKKRHFVSVIFFYLWIISVSQTQLSFHRSLFFLTYNKWYMTI